MSGQSKGACSDMKRIDSLSVLAASVLGCCWLAAPAHSAEGDWQQTVVIYGMGAALDGTAQIGDVEVPVDLSISDVFDALEMGAMGAYRIANDTWSFMADVTYMGLGATVKSQRDIAKAEIDMDQMTVMGTLGRRWTDHLEFLFSLAYVDLSTELTVTVDNPLTPGELRRKAAEDASWVDPLVGLQYHVPFADNWRFNLRGDIGGFGIGSDLTWQLLTTLRWQANDTFGVVAGYRVISFDYEDGKGSDYERYDLTEQGPLVGMTISF